MMTDIYHVLGELARFQAGITMEIIRVDALDSGMLALIMLLDQIFIVNV